MKMFVFRFKVNFGIRTFLLSVTNLVLLTQKTNHSFLKYTRHKLYNGMNNV